jgi:glycosyltransferase involved in cell wall biosynthesis
MNILFVLYGDFTSNSANPLALYARELQSRGHKCAVAVPCNLETINLHDNPAFTPVLYSDVLASPDSIFPHGRPADVVHACTPREVVRRFLTSYMAVRPTPLVIYLEDNEWWISARAIGFDETTLLQHTEQEISTLLPDALAHPFYFDSFIGLADAVAVIQDKLRIQVPPWVRCETVMLGVDLDFFTPRPADTSLREKYGVAQDERVIVYHGGVDQFKSLAIETLCRAVGLINRQGFPCRLLRTGIRPLECFDRLPDETASAISDLGLLPRRELPDLLALADVFVQPGQIDPFEELRLPGKVPEFLAMERPVIMPNANVAHLFRDGWDAVLLSTGTAEEIAEKCIGLFSNPYRASEIGRAGRALAQKYFDVKSQARRLQDLYEIACENFDPAIASATWSDTDHIAPVRLVLARRLRAMADSRGRLSRIDGGEMLREHARYIEFTQQRLTGLEAGIINRNETKKFSELLAERDRQITELHQILLEMQSSISWRASSPIRFAGRALRKIEKDLLRGCKL